MKVEIFGADWCKPCQNTKTLCEEKKLDYVFKDITADSEAHKEVEERLGKKTNSVPHVFVNGEYIGQSTEFKQYLLDNNI